MTQLSRIFPGAVLLVSLLLVIGYVIGTRWTPAPDEAILRDHLTRYSGMEAADLYKLVFQTASGPGHLGKDPQHLLHWLNVECSSMDSLDWADTVLVEPIGRGYVRVHLAGWLASGRTLEQLAKLVADSAVPDDSTAVQRAWYQTLRLFACGRLHGPSTRDLLDVTRLVRKHGWPPIHHSEYFNSTWRPHYRVVALSRLRTFFRKEHNSPSDNSPQRSSTES